MPSKNAIRNSARGELCSLHLDWCCNRNPETTVYAHVGKHGSAKRNHDDEGVYACSSCHDAIDGRSNYFHSDNEDQQRKLHIVRDLCVRNALRETRLKLKAKGLLEEPCFTTALAK